MKTSLNKYYKVVIEDILSFTIDKQISITSWDKFKTRSIPPPSSRRARVRDWEQQGHYNVFYNGKRLAYIVCRPHLKVTIFELFDEDRHMGKLFENVLYDLYPQATVKVTQGE